MIKSVLRCWLLLLLPLGAAAAEVSSDTLSIRFRLDSIRIDMTYAGNAGAWEAFESKFNQYYSNTDPHALSLDIYSGASPEGSAAHNRWLGENRGIAIRRLVRQRLGDRLGCITVHNEAARWEGLYEAVARSSEPWRDEVLRIIEMPASADENQFDHREYKLRALRGGRVWPVLLDKYLAPLRSGATAILSWRPDRDTVVVRDTIIMEVPAILPQNVVFEDSAGHLRRVPDSARVYKPVVRRPVWIMRTNIPLLATATPNLQLEWSLGHKDKWSLNVEGVWSWWTFAYNAYANEIIYGSLELRRWLGRRWRHHTLDGWHIGLGVGGGYGDLEWKAKGYQGEVYSGFFNIGWQRRFGRRKQWAFDMGVGLGYAYVPWRRYDGSTIFPEGHEEMHDDHLMWQETSRTNWFGAPHANISIGYVFNQRDAAWKRRKALERDAVRNDMLHYRDSLRARQEYVRDSSRTAEKLREKEIELMPRAERKVARKQLQQERRQAKIDEKTARKQAKVDKREQKRQAKADKKLRKQQYRQEKADRKAEERAARQWARTPEGRAAVRQFKAEEKEARRQARIDEKNARRQAKADKKAAKKQARADRRHDRMKARIDAEHQRHLERLQREMERADQKYQVK